jgi:hypothetical protein
VGYANPVRPSVRLILFAALLVCESVLAQQTPPTPTFQSSVTLVTSDVVVRDRRGQFQANLTKDDFELLEDGVKQELTSFVLVTIYDVLNNLQQTQHRRKAVVLISNGYDFDPFAATRAADSDPLFNMGTQFNDADLTGRLAELTRQANRANTTIYAFDPRGLVAGQDIDEPVDPMEWQTHVRKTQDSMRVIADLTGGFAVVNTNDFAKAMKRIDNETSDYYVLGYYSTNPDPTQRRRVIEIRVKKKGDENLELVYRKEYTLTPVARR